MVAQSATVGTVVTSATGGSQVTTSPPFGASDKIVKPFCNFRRCKDIDFGNLLPTTYTDICHVSYSSPSDAAMILYSLGPSSHGKDGTTGCQIIRLSLFIRDTAPFSACPGRGQHTLIFSYSLGWPQHQQFLIMAETLEWIFRSCGVRSIILMIFYFCAHPQLGQMSGSASHHSSNMQ